MTQQHQRQSSGFNWQVSCIFKEDDTVCIINCPRHLVMTQKHHRAKIPGSQGRIQEMKKSRFPNLLRFFQTSYQIYGNIIEVSCSKQNLPNSTEEAASCTEKTGLKEKTSNFRFDFQADESKTVKIQSIVKTIPI